MFGMEKTLSTLSPSLNDTQSKASLEIDLFRDASKQHYIASIVTQAFTPIDGQSLSLGFTQGSIWLRIHLPAALSKEKAPLLLSVNPPFIDEVQAYIPQPDGTVQAFRTGDQVVADASLPKMRMASFPIQPFDGWQDTPVYLKLTSRNVMMFDVALRSIAQVEQDERQMLFWFSLLFGLIAFALMSSLFVGLMMRDDAFLFYALYLVIGLTLISAIYGWWRFVSPLGSTDLILAICQLVVFLPLLLLFARLLDLKTHYPRFYRFLLLLAMMVLVVGFALLSLGLFQWSVMMAQVLIVFAAMSLVAMGIGLIHKEPLAPFVLLMFSVSFVGVLVRLLMHQGWLPVTVLTQYGLMIGFVWQALALYLMLGYRLNRLHHEKRVADTRADVAEQEVGHRRLFMNMLNHELRTPMAIIDSAACNLLSAQANVSKEDRLRLDKIANAIEQMRQLMQLCLGSDRLLCSLKQSHATLSLARLLESVLAQLATRSDADRVIYEALDEDVRVLGDAELLRLAITNLLDNALKYSAANQDVELLVTRPSPALVRLSVVDKGCGFDPTIDLGKVKRGANVGNTKGLGMGLALVHEIVAQHKGRLFIESSSAAGSVVCIELNCLWQVRRIQGELGAVFY